MKLIIYGTEQKPGEDAKKKVDSSLCHEECVSSCTGTEPSDCDECKHNFYVDDTGKKVNWSFRSISDSFKTMFYGRWYYVE